MNPDLLQEKLVESLLADRRAERRFRFIRTLIWATIFAAYGVWIGLSQYYSKNTGVKTPHVSLVRLTGIVMPGTLFSAEKVNPVLTDAFKDKNATGVILVLNSPGGSPVQSSIIHDKIEQLKHQYRKKVVVVGEDTLASGAYLIASAADKIYVNADSIVGSIGVIMNGFGFVDTLQKLGMTRRVFTAGTHKDRLDPFKPLDPQDLNKVHLLLNEAHQNFIQDVLEGRQGKLNAAQTQLFSGDFWLGKRAVDLGLADAVGNLWDAARKEFHVTCYQEYSVKESLLDQLFKSAENNFHLGSSLRQVTPFVAQLQTHVP